MGDTGAVLETTLKFVEQVYQYTEYEDTDDDETTFNLIRLSHASNHPK